MNIPPWWTILMMPAAYTVWTISLMFRHDVPVFPKWQIWVLIAALWLVSFGWITYIRMYRRAMDVIAQYRTMLSDRHLHITLKPNARHTVD